MVSKSPSRIPLGDSPVFERQKRPLRQKYEAVSLMSRIRGVCQDTRYPREKGAASRLRHECTGQNLVFLIIHVLDITHYAARRRLKFFLSSNANFCGSPQVGGAMS